MALELLGERNEAVEELEDAVAEMKCAALPPAAPAWAPCAPPSCATYVTRNRHALLAHAMGCEGGPQCTDALGPSMGP